MQACRANIAPHSLCAYTIGAELPTLLASGLSFQKRHLLALASRQTRRLASSNSQQPTKFREPRHVEKGAKMSWMDSWSRPSKSQATPAPYYLLPGGESTPYCKTCGRVIGKPYDALLQSGVTRGTAKLTPTRCTEDRRKQERDTCKILLKSVQKPQAWST